MSSSYVYKNNIDITMNNKPTYFKYCIVPFCTNTTVKAPKKIFIRLPEDRNRRSKWLKACRRNAKDISENSRALHVCEDHFNLEQDMDNYVKFRLMGGQKKMKRNAVPHIFNCQVLQAQSSTSSYPETINEEVDIKIEPVDSEELGDKEDFEANDPLANDDNLTEFEEQPTMSKRRRINIRRKPLLPRKNRLMILDDEFDNFAKHVASQLQQLPVDDSLVCQNEIQAVITKARLKVLNTAVKEAEPDVFSTFGAYVGKKIQAMKPNQQKIAENLVLRVISKGNADKLSENTDIFDKLIDQLPIIPAEPFSDITNISTATNTFINNAPEKESNVNVSDSNISEENPRISNVVVSPISLSGRKRKINEIQSINPEELLNLTPSEEIDQQEELNLKELDRLSPVFISLTPLPDESHIENINISNLEPLEKGLCNINDKCETENPIVVQEEKYD